MVSIVYSAGLNGLQGYIVQVEADLSDGLPGMELVGYLGSEVKEARERVRMALRNSGCPVPLRRITVNLAPANVRKSGTGYDLGVAVGILKSLQIVNDFSTEDTLFIGELSLSGDLCRINGVLPLVLSAYGEGFKRVFLPIDNAMEGAILPEVEVYGARNLTEVINHLTGIKKIERTQCSTTCFDTGNAIYENDFKNVQGQHLAKRGIEVAAAGVHNILLIGPPGSGKSLLSKCIPSILPPLSMEESLEVSSIYSISGKLNNSESIITTRPFVSPHHTVTESAMAGGGMHPRAGLISLAHKGVLFLDEMPEFKRSVLELLRQPLEDKEILISRSGGNYIYPANFMLVGAMNPCPCGMYPDMKRCTCTPTKRRNYMDKLSKPLLDRMDICIEVRDLKYEELKENHEQEDSDTVRKRVINAQMLQRQRFDSFMHNSDMSAEMVDKYCVLTNDAENVIKQAFERLGLSVRAYHRILKVARTIADLDNSDVINSAHIYEALHFRFAYGSN